MLIDEKFEMGELVYLKTDPDQLPRLVTGYTIRPNSIIYYISSGEMETSHYDIEITVEQSFMIKSSY